MNLICIGKISSWVDWLVRIDEILYLNHSFQKQASLSQFEIVTAQGLLKLSVPTIKSTRKGAYRDVKISYDSNWQIEHWRSIENAYQKSPFFIFYNYKIEPLFKAKYVYLYEFNLALFEMINACLKTNVAIQIDTTNEAHYIETPKESLIAYPQVFDDKQPFISDVSVLDILFNLGPEALDYLRQLQYMRP